MNGSRFVKKSRRKSENFHDLLCIYLFLFSLHFCLLCNFEIIRCTVNLVITVQHIFVEVKLKKENLKSNFWAPEFGHPNRYTSLQNGLGMLLATQINCGKVTVLGLARNYKGQYKNWFNVSDSNDSRSMD